MVKDSVVCIRNGKSVMRNNRLTLEIDRWGKVTPEEHHQLAS